MGEVRDGEAVATATTSRPSRDRTSLPTSPLYSVLQIVIATLLGGPLCTAWLMAVNYRRLGAPRKANVALAIGVSSLIAWAASAMLGGALRFGIGAFVFLAALQAPISFQGNALRAHADRRGRRESTWYVVGLAGVLGLTTIVVETGLTLALAAR
ncbi:MAG TPA: hypothetical protein VFP84_07290 [Kofleriaceae bacterium]|nr:hypothetical protein [Kofleriaceae bacterium]